MGNQGDDVQIECVPPGQLDTSKAQAYEWRTVDNKIIVDRPRKIKVDVNTGLLRIYNVKFEDSAKMYCSAVFSDEERYTFPHNLIGICSLSLSLSLSVCVSVPLSCCPAGPLYLTKITVH